MSGSSLVTLKPSSASQSARPTGGLFFRLRVYVVAVLVGILPFIYTLAIIALTGLAIWHSHRTVMAINFNAEFGLRDFNLIVAVVAEAVVSLLLMRQVIAPGCNSQTRQELLPGDQPEFFEVVRLVADRVGSPVPEKVLVDCSAHLQADYASSLDALLRRRLRLRLGMSLPVAFDASQMVAMLAHELGYFSKGTGVAASRFIRGVHSWFDQRIRRDPWLEWLHDRCISRRSNWRWLFRICWLVIWLSLRPLRLMHGICRLISSETMRQMVYKADDCAAKMAGSEALITAMQQRALAAQTWSTIHERTRQQLKDRLPDNIPLLVAREILLIDPSVLENLPATTHWVDMAPTDAKRQARVRKMQCPGIVECEGDGTSFFRNFHEGARRATYFHYQNDWKLVINHHRLVAVEETVHENRASMETINILNRYFRGLAHPERAFCGIAEEQTAHRDPDVLRLELQDCRDWLNIYSERMASALSDWTATWQLVRDLEMAYLLSAAGLPVNRGQFSVDNASPEAFREEINRQRGIMDNMEGILRQFEGKLETRLASSLELLWRCDEAKLPPKLKEVREPLAHWVLVYEALGLHLPVLRELMTHFHAFQSLGASVAGVVDSASYVTTVQQQIPRLVQLVKDIVKPLAQWPYPFQTNFGSEPISLACFVAPQAMEKEALNFARPASAPHADMRAEAQQNAKRITQIIAPMLDRYLNLYHQAFAWVTKTADMSEWHFLDPLAPEFANTDIQKLSRPHRHVDETPPPMAAMTDPELTSQRGSLLAVH
jgi:hypothetical protein